MGKFYYEAKQDLLGTRICKGDTIIIDAKGDPKKGDIVLISFPPDHKTVLDILTTLYSSDAIIHGRVSETLIHF